MPQLHRGMGLVGAGNDALGATFAEIYNGQFHFVVWNDQFYSHPAIAGCGDSCSSPWGHSKGVIAWNDAGEGILLQVTTPSWPAAASAVHPREGDGNTLGCITDNDVKVSQDFFALRLTEHDVETVLDGLANASIVTDITNLELVSNGGPMAIQQRVLSFGTKSNSTHPTDIILSTGVRLITKPSALSRAAVANGIRAARRRRSSHGHVVDQTSHPFDNCDYADCLLGQRAAQAWRC